MRNFLSVLILTAFGLLIGCAGMTPLMNAVERGDIQGVRTLLDQGAGANKEDAADAVVTAARAGHLQVVELFLKRGVNPNLPYRSFNYGFYALGQAASKGHLEIVRLLLDHGADVNSKDNHSHFTALHHAASKGHTQIVRLLLDRGADVSIPDYWGTQLLWWAVRDAGNAEIVQMLLEHGADPGVKGREIDILKKWRTPLAVAQEKGNTKIVRLLQQAEAKHLGIALPMVASVPTSDVDTPPARRAKPNKNAYAIVIGIENYRQKLPKADFATHDAQTMTEYLTKVMGYPEENVVTLTNDRASLTDFIKYFEKWLPNNVEKDSSVFIYYSGHGAPNVKTGDAFLVPYDGDPSFIDQTGYPLKRLYESLGKLPAKEIVVALDSCFSGAGGRSVIAKGARPLVMQMESLSIPQKIAVLSAASGDQISSTYDEKGHGLFTYFMLKGIKNEDVTRQDGSIKIDDLFGYIKPQVERIARKQYNNEQTPQLFGGKTR